MAGEVHLSLGGGSQAFSREQAIAFANELIRQLGLPEPYIALPWFGRRWADRVRVWWAYRTGALTQQTRRVESILSPPWRPQGIEDPPK